MRYMPAAIVLSLLAAVTSSVGYSAPPERLNPRAAELLAEGRGELAAGHVEQAVSDFEAALTVQPGSTAVLIDLGEAARRRGMQGKALHFYREALSSDPGNLTAIAGEGEALAEKGAMDKARRNLARLKNLCGSDCEATRQLTAAIAKGPVPEVVTAEAVKPNPIVTEN